MEESEELRFSSEVTISFAARLIPHLSTCIQPWYSISSLCHEKYTRADSDNEHTDEVIG